MSRPLSAGATSGYQALYERLRRQVLDGSLIAGSRVASSRELAAQLGLARATVVRAYRCLADEGYLEPRMGSGSFVVRIAPDKLLSTRRRAAAAPEVATSRARHAPAPGLLAPHMPALDHFPRALWARLAGRAARGLHGTQLAYQDPQGLPALREAIAAHWQATRGVRVSADHVIVTAGGQNAFDLCARVLARPGDTAAVEAPGYSFARAAFRNAGLRIADVPVDAQGLCVERLDGLPRMPRLVYTTPSHQQPTGALLSPGRRLALLDFARRRQSLVLEDDYDSEFRYAGRPLPVLQSLDTQQRVILMSSFSKTLFPALRLGFLAATDATRDALVRMQDETLRFASALDQRVLALFMEEGHYARHLRRMRKLYQERRDYLRALLEGPSGKRIRGALDIEWPHTGFAAIGWLHKPIDLAVFAQATAARGLQVQTIQQGRGRAARQGLLLGFGSTPPQRMQEAVKALAVIIAA